MAIRGSPTKFMAGNATLVNITVSYLIHVVVELLQTVVKTDDWSSERRGQGDDGRHPGTVEVINSKQSLSNQSTLTIMQAHIHCHIHFDGATFTRAHPPNYCRVSPLSGQLWQLTEV